MPYVVALLRAATQSRPCKKPALSYTRRRGLSNEDWGRSNESRSQKPEVRRRNAKKKPGARSQKPEEKGTGVGGLCLCLCSFRIPQSQLLIHHSSFIIHHSSFITAGLPPAPKSLIQKTQRLHSSARSLLFHP